MQAGEAAEQTADTGTALDERATAYRTYRAEILRARAAVAVVHVALVGKAARGGQLLRETTRREADGSVTTEREYARGEWKASQFLLATSFREDFGASRRLEHTGADGGPIEHASAGDQAVAALAERLEQVAAERARQLPGGWDAPAGEIEAGDQVADAEVVGETWGDA